MTTFNDCVLFVLFFITYHMITVQTSRSKSRLSLTRADEQKTLASLNDRLAGYIDRYQKLETECIHLTKQVSSSNSK